MIVKLQHRLSTASFMALAGARQNIIHLQDAFRIDAEVTGNSLFRFDDKIRFEEIQVTIHDLRGIIKFHAVALPPGRHILKKRNYGIEHPTPQGGIDMENFKQRRAILWPCHEGESYWSQPNIDG